MIAKKRISVLMSLVLILALASAVSASSIHLKGGPRAKPAFTDLGLALNSTGALSGLGNGDVLISLVATADVTSTCTNNGGNAAPGQNPAPITVSGSQAIPASEVKNGTVGFNVTTAAVNPVIAGAPDCANTNWVETIDDLAFTTATITVEQPVGTVGLTVACTFSPHTSNGLVPGATVVCSIN
jgi:hypothetical protein